MVAVGPTTSIDSACLVRLVQCADSVVKVSFSHLPALLKQAVLFREFLLRTVVPDAQTLLQLRIIDLGFKLLKRKLPPRSIQLGRIGLLQWQVRYAALLILPLYHVQVCSVQLFETFSQFLLPL